MTLGYYTLPVIAVQEEGGLCYMPDVSTLGDPAAINFSLIEHDGPGERADLSGATEALCYVEIP